MSQKSVNYFHKMFTDFFNFVPEKIQTKTDIFYFIFSLVEEKKGVEHENPLKQHLFGLLGRQKREDVEDSQPT